MSGSSRVGEGWSTGQRLRAKVAVVIGGGQSPGKGRATGGRRPCVLPGRAPGCWSATAVPKRRKRRPR